MGKVYRVGQTIAGLKLGVRHDLAIVVTKLPKGVLRLGSKGEPVRELQLALIKLHYLPEGAAGFVFNADTARAVARFQQGHGLHVDGVYDGPTRDALVKALHGHAPAHEHKHKVPPVAPPPHHHPKHHPPKQTGSLREKIVANGWWGIHHEPSIHYRESRPIDGLSHPHKLPLTTDCSGFVTLCYKWAGAPDPNGNGYNGQGYTGTMLSHCRHIPPHQVKAGDLVVFGAFPGKHVCLVLEPGADALLASHGSESGPIAIRFSAESAFQGRQHTWLTILPH